VVLHRDMARSLVLDAAGARDYGLVHRITRSFQARSHALLT
jgi:ATP-dependent protease ClpP protease subunit